MKGTKIALIVDKSEIGRPGGLPERLSGDGIEIAAMFFPDQSASESNRMTYEVFPEPVKIDEQTGAPVYGLTRDCPRILPPAVRGAAAVVFALEVPEESSEESFWFLTNVLGQTLQSAADNGLAYYLIDRPNPLAKKTIEPADLVDQYKPFGSYSRLARKQGLSFAQLARMINGDQMLGVEIFQCGSAP
ncbi:MAG: DUF1343 domain-containing protein [Pirellulaceae bacterium]|nr:DUF1343 domain-containing protein [Pirellulaceae bacterium]